MNDLEHADEFNEKISDYLFWHNAKRPHYALGQMTPIEYIKMNEESAICYGRIQSICINILLRYNVN
jgi:hypothetical protein